MNPYPHHFPQLLFKHLAPGLYLIYNMQLKRKLLHWTLYQKQRFCARSKDKQFLKKEFAKFWQLYSTLRSFLKALTQKELSWAANYLQFCAACSKWPRFAEHISAQNTKAREVVTVSPIKDFICMLYVDVHSMEFSMQCQTLKTQGCRWCLGSKALEQL